MMTPTALPLRSRMLVCRCPPSSTPGQRPMAHFLTRRAPKAFAWRQAALWPASQAATPSNPYSSHVTAEPAAQARKSPVIASPSQVVGPLSSIYGPIAVAN